MDKKSASVDGYMLEKHKKLLLNDKYLSKIYDSGVIFVGQLGG